MTDETDRERLERIKRDTSYGMSTNYRARNGKPLRMTVDLADLDFLILMAGHTLALHPDVASTVTRP